jgi:hypothetical protein
MGVGSPAEMSRAVKNFLDAHLVNNIGMGAYPDAFRGNVAQQRIKRGPVPPTRSNVHLRIAILASHALSLRAATRGQADCPGVVAKS